MSRTATLALCLSIAASGVFAQSTNLTPTEAKRSFSFNGQSMSIGREVKPDLRLAAAFATSAQSCPPHCLTQMTLAPGVRTLGELDLLDFLSSQVTPGTGLVIDARAPAWREKGFIPSSVNIPHTTVSPDNPYAKDILSALGGTQQGEAWDFSNAFDLAIYANGPWSDAAPRLVQTLLDTGYPADKISYYRGGMHLWVTLGLTIIQPQS